MSTPCQVTALASIHSITHFTLLVPTALVFTPCLACHQSDNTESGRVRIAGGDFGTGFVFGSAVAQSSTYLSG
jgi:hypothetical protein